MESMMPTSEQFDDVPEQIIEPTARSRPLDAATRLVDTMRFNNLLPEEIAPKHLRKAKRLILRVRRPLQDIRGDAHTISRKAQQASRREQQVARMLQGKGKAHRVQRAVQQNAAMRAYFAALQDERARASRKIAAARDLLDAWNLVHPAQKERGQRAAHSLKTAILLAAREERITRDILNETGRNIEHINIAEDAMRRDNDTIRLDPVTFTRFVGRRRIRVYVALLTMIGALVAIFFPPWGPPTLQSSCLATAINAQCKTVQRGAGIHLLNSGSGILLGWIVVKTDQSTFLPAQIIPIAILPHQQQLLACDQVSQCTTPTLQKISLQITTSGGSQQITLTP